MKQNGEPEMIIEDQTSGKKYRVPSSDFFSDLDGDVEATLWPCTPFTEMNDIEKSREHLVHVNEPSKTLTSLRLEVTVPNDQVDRIMEFIEKTLEPLSDEALIRFRNFPAPAVADKCWDIRTVHRPLVMFAIDAHAGHCETYGLDYEIPHIDMTSVENNDVIDNTVMVVLATLDDDVAYVVLRPVGSTWELVSCDLADKLA